MGMTIAPGPRPCNILPGEGGCNLLHGQGNGVPKAVGNFQDANPAEINYYGLDFTNELVPGDSIATAVWSCTVSENADLDPAPASRLLGDASVLGAIVTQKAGQFASGAQYVLSCTIQTRLGLARTLWSYLNGVPVGC